MKSDIVNALSIDVEEYYHASIFREGTRGSAASRFRSRVEQSVERILALLSRRGASATFFTLGEVAAGHPRMVRKIVAEGHEVACHGDRHEVVFGQTPEEFRTDIRRAKARLEDVSGQPVIGYRAPNFSIGATQAWAHEILLEEGFRYDSSSYPILHDRYGDPQAPRFPYAIRPANGRDALIEFPIGTLRLLGVNLPIGGGGYFRLLPVGWIRLAIRTVNRRENQPIMFYFHPWELDADQPRPPMPWTHRFRHYVGIERMEAKLSELLEEFRFGTARDILRLR